MRHGAFYAREELYGLTSQIRRSSMSIPTNIAEGAGRFTDKDFARFLQISMGSASEAEYQLLLARDLGFMSNEHYNTLQSQIVEVKKMLASFLRTLRS